MSPTLGDNFPASVPEYDENADIQEAFRLYHQGNPLDGNEGIEGHLTDIDERLSTVEFLGVGAKYQNEPPVAEEGQALPDGYFWVDANAPATALPNSGIAIVSATAPTTNLVQGLLWIDTANSYKLKFYDTTLTPSPGFRSTT